MVIDCPWVKCVGGLLFLAEKSSHHTHIGWVTLTQAHHPLCSLQLQSRHQQLLPDGLSGERGIEVYQGALARKLQLWKQELREKYPLCKGRERVYSLFLCQLPNLVIASISLSPWRAANCLWNGLVIPALVTLSGRPPHAFIILQRKMCFLTSVLHLFSFNFLQFPSPPPQIAHLCCSAQGGMSSASPTTLPVLSLIFLWFLVLHSSQVQKDREGPYPHPTPETLHPGFYIRLYIPWMMYSI